MVQQRFPSVWLRQQRVRDAGPLGYMVELTCPSCQRVRGLDPHALWWLFNQRGWDDRLTVVPKRFPCSGCLVTKRRLVRPTVAKNQM